MAESMEQEEIASESSGSTVQGADDVDLDEFFEDSQFNPYTYSHVLEPGEEDYDDYTEEDARKYPELEKTDQEIEEERSKMSKEDQEHFDEIKQYAETSYRQRGQISVPTFDAVMAVHQRYPKVPTSSEIELEETRRELAVEGRKRRSEIEAGTLQPRKIRRVVPETLTDDIIHVIGDSSDEEADPEERPRERKPLQILIDSGIDPSRQLEIDDAKFNIQIGNDPEDLEVEEIHPDDDSDADSVKTDGTVTSIRTDPVPKKVKELFDRLANSHRDQAETYNELAKMSEAMDPVTLQDAVDRTPAPPNKIPQCIVNFHNEVGDEELKEILALGYFERDNYKKYIAKTAYKLTPEQDVCRKFEVSRFVMRKYRRAIAEKKNAAVVKALGDFKLKFLPSIKKEEDAERFTQMLSEFQGAFKPIKKEKEEEAEASQAVQETPVTTSQIPTTSAE